MCGIVGYTGKKQAAPILLDGLSKLEYRGYDSAGLAVRDGSKLAEVVKATGRLKNLAEKTYQGGVEPPVMAPGSAPLHLHSPLQSFLRIADISLGKTYRHRRVWSDDGGRVA